jgi:hypothetical protein
MRGSSSRNPLTTWAEYRQLVLAELERLDTLVENHDTKNLERFDDIRKEILIMRLELSALKVKSGIWGGVAGSVVVIGMLLLKMLNISPHP